MIAKQLTELRRKHRYTLEEVGKQIGVSKQTLYKYEKGIITNIPSDRIEALAAFYGVTPSYIMGWGDTEANKKSPPTKTVDEQIEELLGDNEMLRKLADAIIDLPDEDIKMMIGLAKAYREEVDTRIDNYVLNKMQHEMQHDNNNSNV